MMWFFAGVVATVVCIGLVAISWFPDKLSRR